MANDVDPAHSPVALATTKGDSESAVGKTLANASVLPPPPPLATDRRRTQSAADLPTQKPTSPSTSATSSPRHSITESLSRSSSFLAAAFSGANLALFSGNASPSNRNEPVHIITVVYSDPGPLYVDLYSRPDGCGAFVKSFRRKPDGSLGTAEASGNVRLHDMLYSINGQVVTDLVFASIIQAAKATTFPCTLVFHSRLPPALPPSPLLQGSGAPSPAKTQASPAKGSLSTSVGAMWSSKLTQMMGEPNLKRSASFGDPAPSPVRRPSLSTPPTFGASPVEAPGKTKIWNESIERVKNSDGVKNLFRIMGGGNTPRARPEQDRETVSAWFDHLELQLETTGDPHGADGHLVSSLVVAAAGRLIGVKDDDLSEISFTWYRKTSSQDLIHIKGVRGGQYFPSIDDADARISVRCQSVRFPDLVRVIEFSSPLLIDAAVKDMVEILLDAGAGSFSATLASNEFDSFQIKIADDRVTLVKISENDDEGGVVASADYHVHLQVLIDPTDQLRFTLKVQELGSMLGCRDGDTCDVKKKQQLAGVSCFFLVAQNPQHRDILASLIRCFRAKAICKEDDDVAHRDELNLFVDPASSLSNGSQAIVLPHEPIAQDKRTYVTPKNHAAARRLTPPRSEMAELPGTPSNQLADFFSLENDLDPSNWNTVTNRSDVQPPSSRTASFTSARNSFTTVSDSAERSRFMQDRLVAQDKEIAMLQEKLASMSVLVKSTDHEKAELVASLDMKDSRIEAQNHRLVQLERANMQLSVSSRELQQVRARLLEETKLHQTCQQQLTKALEDRATADQHEQSTQTDNDVGIPETYQRTLDEAHAQAEAMASAAKELRRQLTAAQTKLDEVEQAYLAVLSERNGLRSRSTELAKELKTVVGPHRSLTDVQTQLQERTHLATQLAIARAEAKRVVDELQEYKDAYDNLLKQQQQSGAADKDKAATQRLIGQNSELQRLVHQLTDSLNEARDQLTATKNINSVLMAKMQEENPELRGSIVSPPMSPMSTASSVHDPRFSDDEDEDEEEDDHNHDHDDDVKDDRGSSSKPSSVLPSATMASSSASNNGG